MSQAEDLAVYLKSLKPKYEEYLNLNYIQSRSDPDEEPYKTKYEARKILSDLNDRLEPQIGHSLDLFDEWSAEFQMSDQLAELKCLYEHHYETLNKKCFERFSLTAKSYLLRKLFEFNLAKNYIETEEIESGERLVSKMVRELTDLILFDKTQNNLSLLNRTQNDYDYNPLIFNLLLNSLNELVYVWSHRGDYKRCLNLVHTIEELYLNYKEVDSRLSASVVGASSESYPFDPSELICLKKDLTAEKRRINFETLYTHSLFYMAQIYGKLDDREKSAYYIQLTLQRQMDEHYNKVESTVKETILTESDLKEQQPQERVQFNSLEWATHAAALSQYHLTEWDFATARHCLCCAEAILNVLNNDEQQRNTERLLEQTASIRRCWGKFAIELLKKSKAMLLESADLPDQKSLLNQRDKVSKFRFNLPKEIYKLDECELNAITSNIALDYEEARMIFLKAQTILNQAKDFFKLDGYVTDHCEVIRDLSELYGCLVFFEADADRRCKMLKRRLDMIVPICDDLNEQYYLQLKRQYLFDTGSVYSELMDNKVDIFKEKREKNQLNAKESASAILKINTLATNSIECFEKFLNTMKVQPERKVLPDKFDDHNVRPALLAKFYIGRLYSKIIVTEPEKKLVNVKNTYENYSYLVDYCDRHSQSKSKEESSDAGEYDLTKTMKIEYDICKEMIVYLPAQMDKLRELIK